VTFSTAIIIKLVAPIKNNEYFCSEELEANNLEDKMIVQ